MLCILLPSSYSRLAVTYCALLQRALESRVLCYFNHFWKSHQTLIRSGDRGLISPKAGLDGEQRQGRRGAGTALPGDRGTALSLTGEKGFPGC